MSKPLVIFVDSDAFIALAKKDDSNHKKAKIIFEHLQEKSITFITSNYVFSEVITVLSQRVNHKTAVAFIDAMQSDENMFSIAHISEDIQDKAVEVFKRQTSKNVSFVDCINIAFIKSKQVDAVFSFDKVYKKNRIRILENGS